MPWPPPYWWEHSCSAPATEIFRGCAGRDDRLAAVPTHPGFVLHAIALLRLRALLTRVRSDNVAYRDLVSRYRAMAESLGFEGHIAWAEAMP